MKKKLRLHVVPRKNMKLLLIRRSSFVILLLSLLQSASVYSQQTIQTTLSINIKNTTLEKALNEIEQKTNFVFFYNADQIQLDERVSLKADDANIKDVLTRLFQDKKIAFKIVDHRIVLYPKKIPKGPAINSQQSKQVKGKVTNTKGESIPGVTIRVKGTTIGTTTDLKGNYTLDVPANSTLVFSFVGMKSQEIEVSGKTQLDVVMQEQAVGLNELVVIGYGSQRKKDLTGAVAIVQMKDISSSSIPVPSISDALEGRATGVQVISSGTPGNDATFRIRGVGTINNTNPLLVIDGVPVSSGLNQLSMNDVKTIQVLKDASATAIYGSRGANGVIIITTKRGKGKSHLDFNYYFGLQKAAKLVKMLDARQFATLDNEIMQNAGLKENPAFANPSSLGTGTDWLGALFGVAPMKNYSLSYSGNSKKANYYVSINYLNQQGIILNTGYKRFTMQFNTDFKVFKNLKFGNSLTINHDIKTGANTYLNIQKTMLALPTQPILRKDGTYSGPVGPPMWVGDIVNPIGLAKTVSHSTKGYNLIGSVYGEYEIITNLKFKSTFGLQANFWNDRTWAPNYHWDSSINDNSYLYEQYNKNLTWVWDNTVTYVKSFGKNMLTLMAGTSAQENQYNYLNGSVQNFASNLTQQMDNGTQQPTVGGSLSSWSLFSYMGRANYSYANKYLITATVRRDGSSRFGKGNKWGVFPSVSVAWRISEEKFMKSLGFISNMKIRAGYGITGNQNIGNYSFASALQTIKYNFNNTIVAAVVPSIMPNPYVQWEEQKQANIGIDAGLFNQRIVVALDGYIKITDKMLVPMVVPVTTGYSDVYVPSINAGKMENKGVEVSITSRNMVKKFIWNTTLNFSYNRNTVKNINDTVPMISGSIGLNYTLALIQAGYPINEFFGYLTDGIFQTQAEVDNHAVQVPGNDPYNRTSPGDIRYKDVNNDGVINDKDRVFLGNPNPQFIFSLNNSFAYKGFDLSIFLQGVAGNKILNANRIWSEAMSVAQNQTTATLNRWTGPGTSNSMPRAIFGDPNNNTRPSDRYIEDGSYLRIKNLILGYTFPEQLTKQVHLNKIRVFVSVVNLYTLTKYSGFDPEVGSSGIDNNVYPVSSTYSFGVNLGF